MVKRRKKTRVEKGRNKRQWEKIKAIKQETRKAQQENNTQMSEEVAY